MLYLVVDETYASPAPSLADTLRICIGEVLDRGRVTNSSPVFSLSRNTPASLPETISYVTYKRKMSTKNVLLQIS